MGPARWPAGPLPCTHSASSSLLFSCSRRAASPLSTPLLAPLPSGRGERWPTTLTSSGEVVQERGRSLAACSPSSELTGSRAPACASACGGLGPTPRWLPGVHAYGFPDGQVLVLEPRCLCPVLLGRSWWSELALDSVRTAPAQNRRPVVALALGQWAGCCDWQGSPYPYALVRGKGGKGLN